MSEESKDILYGEKGIDTGYEREKITYRPHLSYSKEKIQELLRPETKQAIERSRTFTISQNLIEYDELVEELDQLLMELELRNDYNPIKKLQSFLEGNHLREITEFEKRLSGYNQTGDFELYTILYHMRSSIQDRRQFIDQKFRTQITDEAEIDSIQEFEKRAIDEWEYLEAKAMDMYQVVGELHNEDEPHSILDESLSTHQEQLSYEDIEKIEHQKREKEILHVSLADTSYVHRNRYFMFLSLIEQAKILIYYPHRLIDQNLEHLIWSLTELPSLDALKTHLILQFKKVRDEHNGIKGRILTVDDGKENFASEKQYLYQQLEVKTIEPIKNWLFSQEDKVSKSFDKFATIITSSMKQSRREYEDTTSELLNFYKSESDYYTQQMTFLKNKEEIRKFFRIIEDLEDVDKISSTWVEEYLKSKGYSV